jgi:hypothetical protein
VLKILSVPAACACLHVLQNVQAKSVVTMDAAALAAHALRDNPARKAHVPINASPTAPEKSAATTDAAVHAEYAAPD